MLQKSIRLFGKATVSLCRMLHGSNPPFLFRQNGCNIQSLNAHSRPEFLMGNNIGVKTQIPLYRFKSTTE